MCTGYNVHESFLLEENEIRDWRVRAAARTFYARASALAGNFLRKNEARGGSVKRVKRTTKAEGELSLSLSFSAPFCLGCFCLSPFFFSLLVVSLALLPCRALLKAGLKIVCMANANRVPFVFLPE